MGRWVAMTDSIAIVLGTRPEIIKLAPVIHACEKYGIQYTVIHTGQHYSENLDSVFFEQLELPEPEYNLQVGSAQHGEQTGEMLIGVEQALNEVSPTTVLVQGDTNSVLAGSIAASKLDVTLGHVEAGLRSFDREMPEETNRVVADHVSDLLFAPTEESKENLLSEGIPPARITVTGNTVVDALDHTSTVARAESSVIQDLGLANRDFFLLTLHREENVDNAERFEALLFSASRAADKHDVPVIYPIHPRARNRLEEFDIDPPEPIQLTEPQEYFDFLRLEDQALVILSDSGGVQEEACILGTPCVTLRDTTERPETVSVGANVLAEHDPASIISSVDEMVNKPEDWTNPFGDGTAGETIVKEVTSTTEEVKL
jgi:UDP-N-acetylglucosamine 2-epimerase (non-hydrolysing)